MTMAKSRRAFLQTLLTGGAVLTAGQAETLRQLIDKLPASDRGDFGAPLALQWKESVKREEDLPPGAQEGDAVFVWKTFAAHVFVDGVGWVRLKTGLRP
jgi:hypothetical protein